MMGDAPYWASGAPFSIGSGGETPASYLVKYQAQIASFRGDPPTTYTPAQLYQYIKSPKILRCPNDVPGTAGSGGALFYKRAQFLTSYSFNGAVNGYPATCRPTYRLAQFHADDIMLWEPDEKGVYNDTAAIAGPSPADGVSGRHGSVATIGMFGGGADRISIVNFWKMANDSNRNSLWCSPNGSHG